MKKWLKNPLLQVPEMFMGNWSGRADLAGERPWMGHNQKDTSSPEAIRVIRMASRPTLPPHLIGGMTMSSDSFVATALVPPTR